MRRSPSQWLRYLRFKLGYCVAVVVVASLYHYGARLFPTVARKLPCVCAFAVIIIASKDLFSLELLTVILYCSLVPRCVFLSTVCHRINIPRGPAAEFQEQFCNEVFSYIYNVVYVLFKELGPAQRSSLARVRDSVRQNRRTASRKHRFRRVRLEHAFRQLSPSIWFLPIIVLLVLLFYNCEKVVGHMPAVFLR